VISYFHVVMGEVVPKNLAIAKADRLAALVAPAAGGIPADCHAVRGGYRALGVAITRAMRVRTAAHGGGHSAEELKLIVSSSRGLGYCRKRRKT
jgi:putative hemolysin